MSHSGRHNAPNSAPKRHVWQCNMAHPAMQYGTQDRENKPVQQCYLWKFRPCHATNVTTDKRASAENPWNTKPTNDFQGFSVCLDFKKKQGQGGGVAHLNRKQKSSTAELSRNAAQTPTATCAYGHGHAQRQRQAYNSLGKKNPQNFLFN